MARVAGALLAIDFASAAAHFRAGLRGLGALALRVQNRADNRMHGRNIDFRAENGLGQLYRADVLSLHIQYFNSRHVCVLLPDKLRP